MTELSARAREQLRLARIGLSPSAAEAQQVRVGVATAVALGTSASGYEFTRVSDAGLESPGLASTAVSSGAIGKWLASVVIAAVAGGAGGLIGYELGRSEGARVNSARIEVAPSVAPPTQQALDAPVIAPVTTVASDSLDPGAQPGPATKQSIAKQTLPAQDPKAEEVFQLQRVQRALRDRNPQLSLAILHELDSTIPRGRLMEERAAARVIALCLTGEEPAVARQTFSNRYPTSIYIAGINEHCGAATESAYPGQE